MDERERHFIGGLLDGEDAPVGAVEGGPGPLTPNPTPHFWPEPPPPYSPRPPTWAQMRQPGPPPHHALYQQPAGQGVGRGMAVAGKAVGGPGGPFPLHQGMYHQAGHPSAMLPGGPGPVAPQPQPLIPQGQQHHGLAHPQQPHHLPLHHQQHHYGHHFAAETGAGMRGGVGPVGGPRGAYAPVPVEVAPKRESPQPPAPRPLDVLSILNVGSEIAAKVMDAKSSLAAAVSGSSMSRGSSSQASSGPDGGVVVAGRQSGEESPAALPKAGKSYREAVASTKAGPKDHAPSPSGPAKRTNTDSSSQSGEESPAALPKAGKSYREAVASTKAGPKDHAPSPSGPAKRTNTDSSSQSGSRKASEGADDVFETQPSPGHSPHHPPSLASVFPEGKLGELSLTAEEMAFLAKGTELEARNLATRHSATSTRAAPSAEFQKISRRKGAKAAVVAGEAASEPSDAQSRFQVLAKGGSPLRSLGLVRSAKMNNEDRAAAQNSAARAALNFSINNDLHSDGVDSAAEGLDDDAAPRKAGGADAKMRKASGPSAAGSSGAKGRPRRDDSERRPKRRRKGHSALLWQALVSLLLSGLAYLTAGLRWLWDLVADIGLQLWDIAAHVLRSSWHSVSSAVVWAWWRLGERARGLGRAWRERDWSSFLPAFLRPKDADAGQSSWGLEASIALPATGDEAMRRLLGCRGQDAYSILGLRADCSDDDIRRYYKRQAVLVHPDKNTAFGAEEAFKILATAFEMIQTPEQRRKYDVENIHKTKAMQELEELLGALKAKMEEALCSMQCDCGGKHKRFPTKRAVSEARYCRRCSDSHAARDNDIWAESHWLGFLWYYYACMDGVVYDITEWAACPRNLLKHIRPNSHLVQYRLITGKGGPPPPGQAPGPGPSRQGPPREAEMEALLSRFLDSGGAGDSGAPSAASYRPPAYPPPDSGRPRKANRRRKK